VWNDIKSAAVDGVVLGVKYGIAAVLIVIAVSWLLGDYGVTRQRAAAGQRAYDALVKQAQQKPAN